MSLCVIINIRIYRMNEFGKCDCGGNLSPYIDDDVSCSCHINPPCAKCTEERLVCDICEDVIYPEYVKPIKSKPYVQPAPRSDINTGISYTTKRSGVWVIVTGLHRKGMPQNEVKNKLGNFDKYHMFRMKSFTNTGFSASWCTN